jgi:peptide/nickel transport system ATP-binding protein
VSLLAAEDLECHFPAGRGLFARRRQVHAVSGVSLALDAGATLGLVGESGSGKSTLGRMLAGIQPPSAGRVLLDGEDMAALPRQARARDCQMVFQDTLGSLNPRLTIGRQLREVLDIHAIGPAPDRGAAVAAMLTRVGIDPAMAGRYPHTLSGGQRQRVVIARALLAQPRILICDEPVSALDVSVQAQIIAVLLALRDSTGVAALFISHDLRVVRQVCGRIAVMYLGRIVEEAHADDLLTRPRHPYSQALIAAVPGGRYGVHPGGAHLGGAHLGGEPPSPIDPPPGCRFHPRCSLAVPACRTEAPALRMIAPGHRVACHRVEG